MSCSAHNEFPTRPPTKAILSVLQTLPGVAVMLLAGPAAAQDQSAPTALELPQVNVVGTGESAFGPVSGYRATRSSTATRTDTPIRDVPQGITVLPRELLDDQRITSLPEAVRLSPSVNGGDGYFANFFVRGFEATQLLNGAPRPFGVVSNRLGNELANVERIEILKGPSSILYGTVAPGGVINRVTRRPLLDGPHHSLTGQVRSDGLYRTEFDTTGPIGSVRSFGYRITGAIEAGRTYRDLSEGERYFIAPSFSWQPSADTRIFADFSAGYDNRLLDRGLPLDPARRRIPRVPRDRSYQEPRDRSRFEEYSAQLRVEHDFTSRLSGQLRLDWGRSREERNGLHQLGNVGADGRTVARTYSLLDSRTDSYGVDGFLSWRFETGPVSHRLVVGADARSVRGNPFINAFFTASPIDLLAPVYGNVTPPRATSAFATDYETRSYGLYAQDQLSLFNDRLLLLLGARFDNYDIEALESANILVSPVVSRRDRSSRISPQLGLVYKPVPDVSLYASYSESFRAPTGSSSLGPGLFPRPEIGEQLEAGVKADLLEDRLSATLAVFQVTKQNIVTANPADPNFSIQVGEARSRGVEFEMNGRLAPGWNIFGGVAWTDAEVTSDTRLRAGTRLPEIPRFAANLWTSYEFAPADERQRVGLGGGVFHRGNRYFDAANIYAQGDYTLVNLAGWWRFGPVLASLNLNNLLNEYYISERTVPGAGRTLIGRATVSF